MTIQHPMIASRPRRGLDWSTPILAWLSQLAAIFCLAVSAIPAAAGSIYGVYQDTGVGYPAVSAKFDTSGAVASTTVIGQYFGGGSVAPLQYPITGLAYGAGKLYGAYADTGIGYPAVLASYDTTGAIASANVIGTYFGGGAIAPLQYSLTGLTYGNDLLYGVFQDSGVGYPAVLATIDPATGNVKSASVIGTYFGGGAIAPLQYAITGLAFGNGEIYGVYNDSGIGYPSVLAAIDPATGNVKSANVIGEYFGGGAIAPLQYAITGLTFGEGQLFGVYQDTGVGYPAVLAAFDTGGAVSSTNVIGQYFGGGAIAPLQYPITGLAYVATGATVPEPASWALMLAGFGLIGTTMRRRQQRGASAI